MHFSFFFLPHRFSAPRAVATAALALTIALTATSANAANCTWSGATDGLWSKASNWVNCNGSVPVNDDTLFFPESALNKNNTFDLAALSRVAGLRFPGSGYTLQQGAAAGMLGIGVGGIDSSAVVGSNVIQLKLELRANQAFVGKTAKTVLGQEINLGGRSLSIQWSAPVNGVAPWEISGVISGSGSISATGSGGDDGLVLAGNNSYAGRTLVNSGYILLASATALGLADNTAENGTEVSASASLRIDPNIVIGNEALTLSSGLGQNGNGMLLPTGGNVWSGSVFLPDLGTSLVRSVGAGLKLTFAGAISGAGGLRFGGGPQVVFALANPSNSFSGILQTTPGGAVIQTNVNGVLPNTALSLAGMSTLNLNGSSVALSQLSCTITDTLLLPAGSKLTLGSGNGTDTCAGTLTGSKLGGIQKIGFGELRLGGDSSAFAGDFTVSDGVLNVQGKLQSTSSASISVTSGGSLVGRGDVGKVVVAGTIVGRDPSAGVGATRLSALRLQVLESGTVQATMASAQNFDRLQVNNLALANGAVFSPQLTFSAPFGAQFLLINNVGNSPINGVFANAPQGSVLVRNAIGLKVDYTAGDGNDFALTAVEIPLFRDGFEAGNTIGFDHDALYDDHFE